MYSQNKNNILEIQTLGALNSHTVGRINYVVESRGQGLGTHYFVH